MEVPKSNRKGRKSAKETLPPTDPAVHHHISMETRNKLDIADFLDTNEGDAALEVCYDIHYDFLQCSDQPFHIELCSSAN